LERSSKNAFWNLGSSTLAVADENRLFHHSCARMPRRHAHSEHRFTLHCTARAYACRERADAPLPRA
jgi:hypothetical protein